MASPSNFKITRAGPDPDDALTKGLSTLVDKGVHDISAILSSPLAAPEEDGESAASSSQTQFPM